MSESPVHDTFEIVKTYPYEPAAVFRAFSDRDTKARWYAESPSNEQLEYTLDFRVDGTEKLRARMLPGTPIAGVELCWTGRYVEIADKERIVFFQTLDMGDKRISGAVVTMDFASEGDGTRLTLTHQAVYFEGADGPDMRKYGWQSLLESAEAVLEAG